MRYGSLVIAGALLFTIRIMSTDIMYYCVIAVDLTQRLRNVFREVNCEL